MRRVWRTSVSLSNDMKLAHLAGEGKAPTLSTVSVAAVIERQDTDDCVTIAYRADTDEYVVFDPSARFVRGAAPPARALTCARRVHGWEGGRFLRFRGVLTEGDMCEDADGAGAGEADEESEEEEDDRDAYLHRKSVYKLLWTALGNALFKVLGSAEGTAPARRRPSVLSLSPVPRSRRAGSGSAVRLSVTFVRVDDNDAMSDDWFSFLSTEKLQFATLTQSYMLASDSPLRRAVRDELKHRGREYADIVVGASSCTHRGRTASMQHMCAAVRSACRAACAQRSRARRRRRRRCCWGLCT